LEPSPLRLVTSPRVPSSLEGHDVEYESRPQSVVLSAQKWTPQYATSLLHQYSGNSPEKQFTATAQNPVSLCAFSAPPDRWIGDRSFILRRNISPGMIQHLQRRAVRRARIISLQRNTTPHQVSLLRRVLGYAKNVPELVSNQPPNRCRVGR